MVNSVKDLRQTLGPAFKKWASIRNDLDSFYKEKQEPKYHDDGSPKLDKEGNQRFRTITPSLKELKRLQKACNKQIFQRLDFPACALGSIKGHCNVENAKHHQGKKYRLKVDLKDFFPSTRPSKVRDSLINNGFSQETAGILTRIVTYKNCLPQGAPTSPYVSNLVLIDTDKILMEYCKNSGIKYTRFVDDLVFSSEKDFRSEAAEIIQIISNSSGYKVAREKVFYRENELEITGVLVKNNNLTTTIGFKSKAANKLSDKSLAGRNEYERRVKSYRLPKKA